MGSEDERLIEHATSIPFEEFVRAYTLMASPAEAQAALRDVVARLRANPGDDFVMGPNFLAVLALFSERGRAIAKANMAAADIRRRQQELAAATPRIAQEFPELLRDDA